MNTYILNNIKLNYEFIYKKTKYIHFKFINNVLIISGPIRKNDCERIISENIDTILKLYKRTLNRVFRLEDNKTYNIVGDSYTVHFSNENKIVENQLYIKDYPSFIIFIANKLRDYCDYVTKLYYKSIFNDENYPSIIYKITKTYSGQYNKKKHQITYNIGLGLQEPILIDYVIVHELCHIKYMDHQDGFHKLLEENYPNASKASKQLKERWVNLC